MVGAVTAALSALHGTPAVPAPHWAVLLTVVPAVWLVIGGGVVLLDRVLRRFE